MPSPCHAALVSASLCAQAPTTLQTAAAARSKASAEPRAAYLMHEPSLAGVNSATVPLHDRVTLLSPSAGALQSIVCQHHRTGNGVLVDPAVVRIAAERRD